MSDTETLDRMEEAYAAGHDIRCTVEDHERWGETCGVTARWISYGKPECNLHGSPVAFWCDVRYQAWLIQPIVWCRCGERMTPDHWRVVPL